MGLTRFLYLSSTQVNCIRRIGSRQSNIIRELALANQTSHQAWEKAQQAELHGWLYDWAGLSDDRSEEHATAFHNYKDLPENLGDVLEVGCGPFTQTLRILKNRKARSVVLNDPLAEQYLTRHPKCTYNRINSLCGNVTVLTCQAENLLEAYKHLNQGGFDTIILINVLEHVENADKIMSNVYEMLKDGGLFVFGDRSYDEGAELEGELNKTLHPVLITKELLASHKAKYNMVFEQGDYFIGRKGTAQ